MIIITKGNKNNLNKIGGGLDNIISYRFDSKNLSGFTLRQSGGNYFVVNYTDNRYSFFTVSQNNTINQPRWTENGVLFDGVNHFLTSGVLSYTGREVWSVVKYDLALAKNFDGIITSADASLFLLILNNGTTSLFVNGANNSNARVNNIATTVLLPTPNNKTASVQIPALTYTQINIGQDRLFTTRRWQGTISDIIIFNRILTTNERNFIQAYYQDRYNF